LIGPQTADVNRMSFMRQQSVKTCFVVMPFGEKKDVSGVLVDFDKIYHDILCPAIEATGHDCCRCDQVDQAGNIHRRMFELIWNSDWRWLTSAC
jgi:hypothetical protein